MNKIYIASGLNNIPRVRLLSDKFRSHGASITYDWTTHGMVSTAEELRKYGELEINGVIDANILFFVQPGYRGSHVELGIMLAMVKLGYNKTIVILDENPSEEQKTFYHTDFVNVFNTEDTAVRFALEKMSLT